MEFLVSCISGHVKEAALLACFGRTLVYTGHSCPARRYDPNHDLIVTFTYKKMDSFAKESKCKGEAKIKSFSKYDVVEPRALVWHRVIRNNTTGQ